MNLAQVYDEIYTARPDKWSSDFRDRYAFTVLNEYLPHQPHTLLDVGCGNGHTLKYFDHKWEETYLYGIDLSPVGISIAQKAVPRASLIATPFLEYFPNNKMGVILLMGVMEHFEDIPVHLRRLRSLLSVNGVAYVEVPNSLSYAASKEEGFREEGKQQEWHLKRTTWERMIEDSGLSIERSIIGPDKTMEFIWILK
jgi:trans-aconitate methyltransferase